MTRKRLDLLKLAGKISFRDDYDYKACRAGNGKAAKIYLFCRKQGIIVRSTIDCLIAQIAIEHGLLLLQNDKDFVNMAPIINLKLY